MQISLPYSSLYSILVFCAIVVGMALFSHSSIGNYDSETVAMF